MKKIILVFVSHGVGEIDWLLPLLDKLSKNHIIFTYFRNSKSFYSLQNNKTIYKLWEKNCKNYYIEKSYDNLIFKILKKINENFFKSKALEVLSNEGINNINNISKIISSKLHSKKYKFHLVFSDFQENFLFLEKFKKLKENRPIIIHYPHSPMAYIKRSNYQSRVNLIGDLLFVGRKDDINFFEKSIKKEKIFSIGIPKFDRWWMKKVIENNQNKNDLRISNKDLKKKFIVTISYDSLFNVKKYQSRRNLLFNQLRDLMDVIAKVKNCMIIFNIHPKRNSKKFLVILNKYKKDIWCVSKMSLSQLVRISDCFICVSSSSAGYEALNYKVPFISLPEIEGIDLINDTNKELGFCKIAKDKKDLSKLINHAKNKKHKFWRIQQANFQKNYLNVNKSTTNALKIIAKSKIR